MDINLETILGIVFTLLVGGVGIYYTFKYPIKLIFIPEDCYGLFNSIVTSFPDIEIKYKDQKIGRQIYLLSGYIANIGWRDITEDLIDKHLAIALPENHKWLECRIISGSPDLKVIAKVNDRNLEFELGIFRANEFFYFETLLEIPANSKASACNNPDGGLENSSEKEFEKKEMVHSPSIKGILTPSHRIANANKIIVKDYWELPNSTSNIFKIVFSSIVFLIFLGSILIILLEDYPFINFSNHKEYDYIIQLDNGEREKVKIKPTKGNNFLIRGIESNLKDKVSYLEIKDKYPNIKTIPHDPTIYEIYILPIWIALICFAIVADLKFLIGQAWWYYKMGFLRP